MSISKAIIDAGTMGALGNKPENGMSICAKDNYMDVLITISRDPDWWRARHLTRGDKGHIPRNYVASLSSIECEE